MGATPGRLSLAITIFSVGVSPDHEVDIYVSGNNIRNVTEPAINLRVVGGRAHIERNVIVTGALMGSSANPDAIRIVGPGSYLVAHNTIDCGRRRAATHYGGMPRGSFCTPPSTGGFRNMWLSRTMQLPS